MLREALTRLSELVRPKPWPMDQEVAVTEESVYNRFPLVPYTPDELIGKKGFTIYEEMYRDDQINQSLMALKLMRLSAGHEIIAASEDAKDMEVNDFVLSMFGGMETPLDDFLFSALGALEMGWSIHEIVLKTIPIGRFANRIGIKALKSKNPKYFNLETDEFDNLKSIVSISYPAYGERYSPDKFIAYSFQKRYENIFGTSRLRSLYQWWWVKKVMIRAMGVYMEKFGIPLPVGNFAPGMSRAQQDEFLTALKRLRFESAMILPDGVKVDFKEVSGKSSEAFTKVIEHADKQIIKAILGQTLTTQTDGTGSFSLGEVQFTVLGMYIEQLGRDLATKVVNPLIRRIVDFNYTGIIDYPKFQFKPIGQKDLSTHVDKFLAAVGQGVLKAGPEDERKIREILGFPIPEREKEGATAASPNNPKVEVEAPEEVKLPKATALPTFRLATKYAEKLFTGVKRRSFTSYEEKVDFDEVRAAMDDAVAALLPAVGEVLREAVSRLEADVQRLKIVEDKDAAAVNKLQLRLKGDVNAAIRDGLERVARAGMRDARTELRTAAKQSKMAEIPDIAVMAPDGVLKFLKAKAFEVTHVLSEDVLKRMKGVIFNAIKMGKSYKDALSDMESAMSPYFNTGAADDEQFTAPRLETIIRTNVSEAYNEARKSIFMDPDVRKTVRAFQYSAILDDRVRPNHAAMDARIFPLEHPIWDKWTPPAGYNCRCVLVPVTVYDEPFEVSEIPAVEPDEGFK